MQLKFGEKIRLLRTRAGLHLSQVADRAGIHQATLSKWERQKSSWKQFSQEQLELLASALGRSVEEIKNNEAA